MPFKSEKQRRFLWAEHPDIAKRWAHEYPKSNKKLPMYAHKEKAEKPADETSKEKAATVNISAIVNKYVNNSTIYSAYSVQKTMAQINKTADSKQELIDIPHSEKPVYAGEERENGKITDEIPGGKNISGTDTSGCEKPKNAINDLLTKLSVVLSPHIEQTIENMRAEREGRVAVRIPRNRGIKRYPCATPSIPLPMGMAQAQQPQPQQQPQTPAQPARPVGGGSHPQFNPINAFGAISMSGVINGNAAFGAKNSPDSSKLSCVIKRANEPIDFDQWHGKAFKIVSTPEGKAVKSHTDGTPVANEPGQVSIVTPENGDAWNWPDAPAETVNNFKKNWGSIQGGIAGYKMDQIRRGMQKQPTAPKPPAPSVPQPPKPPVPAPNTGAMTPKPITAAKVAEIIKRASRSEILGKIMSIDTTEEDAAYWEEEYCDELAGYSNKAANVKAKLVSAALLRLLGGGAKVLPKVRVNVAGRGMGLAEFLAHYNRALTTGARMVAEKKTIPTILQQIVARGGLMEDAILSPSMRAMPSQLRRAIQKAVTSARTGTSIEHLPKYQQYIAQMAKIPEEQWLARLSAQAPKSRVIVGAPPPPMTAPPTFNPPPVPSGRDVFQGYDGSWARRAAERAQAQAVTPAVTPAVSSPKPSLWSRLFGAGDTASGVHKNRWAGYLDDSGELADIEAVRAAQGTMFDTTSRAAKPTTFTDRLMAAGPPAAGTAQVANWYLNR